MLRRVFLFLITLAAFLSACDEKTEVFHFDLEQDYQPLEIGYFWIYQVDETIYFGENDSETTQFYYKDLVRSSYLNAEKEESYVISRFKSPDGSVWDFELDYTMIYRDRILLRTINNTPVSALVFPPEAGRVWNGRSYQAGGDDNFEIDFSGESEHPGFEAVPAVRVTQEDLDDKITIRDIRYEVFGKGVGLLEKYDEVLTYCSRNDCLGDGLVNGGSKTHMKLIGNGRE